MFKGLLDIKLFTVPICYIFIHLSIKFKFFIFQGPIYQYLTFLEINLTIYPMN